MDKSNNVILIGMPGAGKSTVGVVLAKALGLQFVDSDLIIQQKTGEFLQDTINTKGIDAFLKIESEVIKDLDLKGFVIATGGSVVYSEEAMLHLKEIGTVLYINVELEDIKKRIDNITTRGIAMHQHETLDSIYQVRTPLYRKYADLIVDINHESLEETVAKTIAKLNLKK